MIFQTAFNVLFMAFSANNLKNLHKKWVFQFIYFYL